MGNGSSPASGVPSTRRAAGRVDEKSPSSRRGVSPRSVGKFTGPAAAALGKGLPLPSILSDLNFDPVRAGISYKFGGPVVAKYCDPRRAWQAQAIMENGWRVAARHELARQTVLWLNRPIFRLRVEYP